MKVWSWFQRSVLDWRASTRSAALLRIGLVFLLWARFANELLLVRSLHPDRIALGLTFFVSSSLFLLGWKTRFWGAVLTAVMFLLSYGYGQVWGVPGWTSHHVVLLVHGTLLVALLPCGGSYSIDRWLALRRAEQRGLPPPPERGAYWALPLLALQLSAIYLWAAVDKTSWGFLSGQRLEMIFMEKFFGSDYPPFPGFRAFCASQAVVVTALQYALAVGLFVRRWRRVLMPAGILMHVVFYYVLPVSVFTLTMLLFYLAFLDPDEVHRVIDRLQAAPGTPEGERRPPG